MRVPLHVVDNFFDTPSLVRDYALKQEYFKGDRGNWPGIRSKFIQELDPSFMQSIGDKLTMHLPRCYTGFQYLEASFQLIDETYGEGWVHNDDPKYNVAGIIYLNPGKPKQGSGTTFYDDRDTSEDFDYSSEFASDVNEEVGRYEQLRNDINSKWVPNVTVEGRWNRCVISDSTRWHCAGRFFGTTKETSRLTLVFFGKVL